MHADREAIMANALLAPWMIETALVGYRDIQSGSSGNVGGLPLPSQFAAVFVLFGALSFFPENGEKVAALLGWGFVIATVLRLVDPSSVLTVKVSSKSASTTNSLMPVAPRLQTNPLTGTNA